MLKIIAALGLAREVSEVGSSLAGLKRSHDKLVETRNTFKDGAQEREAKHKARMQELERSHQERMAALRVKGEMQAAKQQTRMDAFDVAQSRQEVLSEEIDALMAQIGNPAYPDKEAILLELHVKNDEMFNITMSVIQMT